MNTYQPTDIGKIVEAAGTNYNDKTVLLINPPSLEIAEDLASRTKSLFVIGTDRAFYNLIREKLSPNFDKPGKARICDTPIRGFLAGAAPQAFDEVIWFDCNEEAATYKDACMRTLKFGGNLIMLTDQPLNTLAGDKSFEFNNASGVTGTVYPSKKEAGFMILSHPRSGTHLARTTLMHHPDLEVFAEVFHPACYAGHHGLRRTRDVFEAYLGRPNQGFCVHAYYGIPGGVSNFVGGAAHPYKDFWQWAPKGIRVISMRRRNLLARFVSHTRSNTTRQWNVENPDWEIKRPKVRIDIKKLYNDADYVKKVSRHVDQYYPNALIVYYEDLVADPDKESRRMQEYLGVSYHPLQATSRKIGSDNFMDDIANIKEVTQYISRHGGMQGLTQ